MHIVVTNVDSATRQPCTEQPMQTGPAYPAVNNLEINWFNSSEWPIEIIDGVYQSAPEFYGTCDDDSFTGFPGVLDVITEAEFNSRKRTEFYARRPYPSWIFDEATLLWSAPVPMSTDGKMYKWDEATTSWVE